MVPEERRNADAERGEMPVVQGIPIGAPQGGMAMVAFTTLSPEEQVVLNYRLAVMCFAFLDFLTTLLNVLTAVMGTGYYWWELLLLIFLLGPLSGLLGAKHLHQSLTAVYVGFCVLKTIAQIVFAVYFFWLWHILFAFLQIWITKIVFTFCRCLSRIPLERRAQLLDLKVSAPQSNEVSHGREQFHFFLRALEACNIGKEASAGARETTRAGGGRIPPCPRLYSGRNSESQPECTSCGFRNKSTNEICGGNGPLGCKASKATGRAASPALDFNNLLLAQMGLAPMPTQAPTAGFWTCSCGFRNKATNHLCGGNGPLGCKTPKTPVSGTTPVAVAGRPTPRIPAAFNSPADFDVAALGGFGPQRTKQMPGHATPYGKGLGKGMMGFGKGQGEWKCRCGFGNKASNLVCGGANGTLGCKAGKEWICGACNFVNKNANTVCGGEHGTVGCKSPNMEALATTALAAFDLKAFMPQMMEPQWACLCGFKNKASNSVCGGGGPLGCKLPRSDGQDAVA
ncbi:unnamed protein product [Effrenium voratum]|nr:unnamed protein product [Effrenium voratum]